MTYYESLEPTYLPLSAREKEVLRLRGDGLSVKEVAVRLGLSPQTVKNHMQNIFAKLGIHNTAGVACIDWAMRHYLGEA